MTIKAKPILDNKFWIVEDAGVKVGTLSKEEDNTFVVTGKGKVEYYTNENALKNKFGKQFFTAKITTVGDEKEKNVRKILNLDDLINKPYSKVTIELKTNYNINEIKDLLSAKGETTINLVIKNKSKKALYCLDTNRKFDLSHLKALKAKNYVEKIIV